MLENFSHPLRTGLNMRDVKDGGEVVHLSRLLLLLVLERVVSCSSSVCRAGAWHSPGYQGRMLYLFVATRKKTPVRMPNRILDLEA